MRKIHKTTLIGIYTYTALTVLWTILCIFTDEFTENDKGLISGLGFLLIFAISMFLANDKIKLRQLFYSVIIVPAIFLTASFLVGLFSMWLSWLLDLPEFAVNPLFVLLSSTVSSLGLSLLIKYLYKINGFPKIFLLFIIIGLISSYLVDLIDNSLFFDYDIPPRITMFVVWQSLMIIPIFYLMNKKNLNENELKAPQRRIP